MKNDKTHTKQKKNQTTNTETNKTTIQTNKSTITIIRQNTHEHANNTINKYKSKQDNKTNKS